MQEMTHRLTEESRRLAFENHDNCVSCGYEFKEGDTSHLGYDSNGNPQYVCDSCSNKLKETAVRHYFSPRPYEIPDKDSYLWRYMDFTKYVSMLSTSCLYFSRADTFEDHFEGAKGVKSNKEKWDDHYLSFFKEAMKNPPEGVEWDKSDEFIEKEAKRLLNELDAGGEASRKRVFISCWHENTQESEAMWRLYSSYIDNAIAIRTTYKSLYESLGRNPSISIGRVKYIDFNKSFAGVNDSFWRKRKSFEHEKEVRALVHDHECLEKGKAIHCNLETLIEEVYLSPKAPEWFVTLLNDVNKKYGLNVKVHQSRLNDEPFY
jgi:hypothetical protein